MDYGLASGVDRWKSGYIRPKAGMWILCESYEIGRKSFFSLPLDTQLADGVGFWVAGGGVGWLRVVCALGVGVSGCKRWKRVSAKWKIE